MATYVLSRAEINKDGLLGLIQSRVEEGQTIDFKRTVNLSADEAKRDLCIDVSAFANASGGDIVFGMDQTKAAVAKALVPLPNFNSDKIELQIRQICRSRIDPPVPGLRFHPVELNPKEFVLVLRIPRSWDRPHALAGEPTTFHVRDGKGNRSMTVRDLREAFDSATSIGERMQRFRTQRIANLLTGEAPAPLAGRSFIALHILPVSAFDHRTRIDIGRIMKDDYKPLLWPINAAGFSQRINFEGLLSYHPSLGKPVDSYVQVFNDGCIEAVSVPMFIGVDGETMIPATYEHRIEKGLRNCLNLLQRQGLEPPFFVSVAFVGTEGFRLFSINSLGENEQSVPIDRDVLVAPEILVESYAATYYDVLYEAFARIWQACGILDSPNYTDGQWSSKVQLPY